MQDLDVSAGRCRRGARPRGLTLVEILIVMAILGILAAIAVPAYNRHVLEGRRADAMAALLAVQLAQARHRVSHPGYSTDLAQLGLSPTSPGGHYQIAVVAATATGFTATATALGPQAADSGCATLTLSLAGHALSRTPAACWPR